MQLLLSHVDQYGLLLVFGNVLAVQLGLPLPAYPTLIVVGAITARMKGLDGSRIGAVVGDLCDAESMVALKDLMHGLGSQNLDCRQDGAALDGSRREFYLFNSSVAGIEEADAILLVGANPRKESPVLNARIRKRWSMGGCPVAYIGSVADLTYVAEHLGDGPDALAALDGSVVAREAFGGGFVDWFLQLKRAEIARFEAEVSEWEQREYFDLF